MTILIEVLRAILIVVASAFGVVGVPMLITWILYPRRDEG